MIFFSGLGKNVSMSVLLALAVSFIASGCFAGKNRWLPYEDNRSSKAHCIQAEGRWSYGTHVLNRTEISPGEVINHDVKISCRGRFSILMEFIPKETVAVIAGDDGLNRYVEKIHMSDGTPRERYLNSHEIYYSVTLSSLIDSKKSISVKEPWTVATYPQGMGVLTIHIPTNFAKNEPFRISVEIEAGPDFYEDYKWLWASIWIPVH